jgi:hypothetical protein
MNAVVAPEVSGASLPQFRLPHSATRRSAVTYIKLVNSVRPDPVWGGYSFEGRILRPGCTLPRDELPDGSLLLECAGAEKGGRGHNRSPDLYILWRLDRDTWREVARAASVGRDWTLDLGPIARRELQPPKPFLVDPEASAARVIAALDHELEPLRREAQVLVVRAVYDRFAARMAG